VAWSDDSQPSASTEASDVLPDGVTYSSQDSDTEQPMMMMNITEDFEAQDDFEVVDSLDSVTLSADLDERRGIKNWFQ